MLRAVWFLAKIALVVTAIGWLGPKIGWLTIDWAGYRTEIHGGFALILLFVFMFAVIHLDRIWRAFVSVPAALRRYTAYTRREKGYSALTQGLVAIAAGDARAAEKSAKSAESLIPNTPLTKLLTAQTALLNGNTPKARREFLALLDDSDAAFFGVRGLLTQTLKEGDHAEALQLIRKAENLQPKRNWIVRTRFELECRNRAWAEAGDVLKKAEKMGIYDKDTARHHRQAVLTARAGVNIRDGFLVLAAKQAAQAFALDHSFTPAALLLAKTYEQLGKRRAAMRTIEKAWKASPHPELSVLWLTMMPPSKKEPSVYETGRDVYNWVKRLTDLNPQHRDSLRALGAAALQASLWKEARDKLVQAADYRALAKLERAETGNDAKAREWLEMAADYPPDAKWVCADCGQIAAQWSALCPHCAGFNRQDWSIPSTETHLPKIANSGTFEGDIIAPPAAVAAR